MQAWSEFLSKQPIQALQHNNTLSALDETGLLYVGGDDASDFLQKQLSNDILKIDQHRSQLSSISNAKGRMLGIFRVIQIDGGYLLVIPLSILDSIQQQLQKFVITARVILADISDSFARFSVTTDQHELTASDRFPAELNQVYQSDSLISLRLPAAEGRSRYLFLSNDAEEAIQLWSQLANRLQINDASNWRLQDIEAAIPNLYPATQGAFVLQMSNLQAIDGVSFKKGCFPGQEVVARMQYLGTLKRRMYLAEIDSETCPQAGDELCSLGTDKKDGSGKVVDAILTGDGKCLMLFIAQIAKTDANQLQLFDRPELSIRLRSLPYPVPEK